MTAGYFWHLWLVPNGGLATASMRPHLVWSCPIKVGPAHDDGRVHLQLDSALSRLPQNTSLHHDRDHSTITYKMAITPIITFKAGKIDLDVRLFILRTSACFILLIFLCQTNSKPYKSTPVDTKGYIYVYKDDEGNIS